LKGRTTGELLVLLIGGTICVSVLISLVVIAILEILDPTTDTTQGIALVSDTIHTLIGLLAGFIAGRTDARRTELSEGMVEDA
jgi:hypothetical protein